MGLMGVCRGGVTLVGVVFTGVGFIGGRSLVVMVGEMPCDERTDALFPASFHHDERTRSTNGDCAGPPLG